MTNGRTDKEVRQPVAAAVDFGVSADRVVNREQAN
jgi:hypothetical protein